MTYASAIEACSRMISGRAANSGAARRISAPLLNIVLGRALRECLKTIRQSYQDCWSVAADQLCWLKTEDCMDEAGLKTAWETPSTRCAAIREPSEATAH